MFWGSGPCYFRPAAGVSPPPAVWWGWGDWEGAWRGPGRRVGRVVWSCQGLYPGWKSGTRRKERNRFCPGSQTGWRYTGRGQTFPYHCCLNWNRQNIVLYRTSGSGMNKVQQTAVYVYVLWVDSGDPTPLRTNITTEATLILGKTVSAILLYWVHTLQLPYNWHHGDLHINSWRQIPKIFHFTGRPSVPWLIHQSLIQWTLVST